MSDHKKAFAYVGNWAKTPTGTGIGICRYHTESGELEPIQSVFAEIIAGATCLDSKRNILYCVNESMTHGGYVLGGGGEVYAFAIDPETGNLTEINHQPSYASLPCDVQVDATGKYLLAVNHTSHTPITRSVKDASGKYRIVLEYDDATTVLYPLNEDGSIDDPIDIYKHSGNGPLPRQMHSQPHSVCRMRQGQRSDFLLPHQPGNRKTGSMRRQEL
jgi:6-phosphogluconolactonase